MAKVAPQFFSKGFMLNSTNRASSHAFQADSSSNSLYNHQHDRDHLPQNSQQLHQPGDNSSEENGLKRKEVYTSSTYHENKEFRAEMVVNPEVLTYVKEGDLMELYNTPDSGEPKVVPQGRRVVLKAILSKDLLNYPFSVHRSVKEAFDLSESITMGPVDNPRDVQADHVELTIKGQFVPRADLFRFLIVVTGETAWGGKVFDIPGLLRARVHQVRRGKEPVYAGVISKQTHVTCRSRSSRIFWLVQLSPEMYDFNQHGDLYYEVFLQFVSEVLERWKELEVAHSLTVVFFCRSYMRGNKRAEPVIPPSGLTYRPVMTAADGKQYEDTYKVVVSNETMAHVNPEKLVWRLKVAFNDFPKTIGWFKKINMLEPTNVAHGLTGPATERPDAASRELNMNDRGVRLCMPAYSKMGNVLEALNVTLNVIQRHYSGRDLARSGNSIVMITAGTGVFDVDGRLSSTTTQRMMDNGIGMDMVSLSRPPLHTSPLFISKKLVHVEVTPTTSQEAAVAAAAQAKEHEQSFARHGVDSPAAGPRSSINSEEVLIQEQPKYEVPHWMNLTFVAGARPRSGPQKAVPAGLASTTPPAPLPPSMPKPVAMPRLVWPSQICRKPDGSVDMERLCMPEALAVLAGFQKVPDFGDDSTPVREDEPPYAKTKVRPWHITEEMYPQPPHGIAGAAEFARRLAEARQPTSSSEIATPPFTPSGRRLKSPTGSNASSVGRFNQDVLGTSPSLGYVGSPRSAGRLILSQLARPWPDKDSNVEAAAQPTLRGSPRNYAAGGKAGGFASGGGGGSVTGAGSRAGSTTSALTAPAEAAKLLPRRPVVPGFRPVSDKKMESEEWKLLAPKFDEYDDQVDQVADEPAPVVGRSSKTVMMGDWGSRPVEAQPVVVSRSSLGALGAAEKARYSLAQSGGNPLCGEITMPLNSPGASRPSGSASDVGIASSEGSSVASSPMLRDSVHGRIGVAASGGDEDDSPHRTHLPGSALRDSSPGHTWSRSPINTKLWGWGRKQDAPRPSTSPGNLLWPPLKESVPSVADAQLAVGQQRQHRQRGKTVGDAYGGGGSGRRSLKSSGGGRLSPPPPHGRTSPVSPATLSPVHDRRGPSPSPVRPHAAEGSESPPAMALAKSSVGYAPGKDSRRHGGVQGPPPPTPNAARAYSRADSRAEGGSGVPGSRIPASRTTPVQIERTVSDGGKVKAGRKSAPRIMRSAPREVPRADSDRHSAGVVAHGHGYGRGQVLAARAFGYLRPGSASGSPGNAAGMKMPGLKIDPRLRKNRTTPMHNPPSHDSSGSAHTLTPTGLGFESSSTDREAFDRDGRFQASVGSTGSGGIGGAGSSSGGGGGFAKRDLASRSRTGTGASDVTGISQRSGGRGRVVEVEFNPFKKGDEHELLKSRTHNRRRWTHVFPPGETEFKTMDDMPGPNWVSLTQPALLPLSIDFLPSRQEISDDYFTSYHDVLLSESKGKTLESVKPVLEEMVAQRVAQDFQIVEKIGPDMGPSDLASAYGSLASKGRDQHENTTWTSEDGCVHILSMGHRLQTLYYNPRDPTTVKVRKFTLKAGSTGNVGYDYAYSLWLPMAGHVQTVTQQFFKYPEPEYPFTYVDNLIAGDVTDLTDGTKFRRLLFNIIPPKITTEEEESKYCAAMDKLAEHMNKWKKIGEAYTPVSFKYKRRVHGSLTTHDPGDEEPEVARRSSARMDMTAEDDKGEEAKDGNDTVKPYSEWLDVCHDEVLDAYRVVQLDVRWLLCSAAKVLEYVKLLESRAVDLNIRLQHVPEYATSPSLNLHPLITHPYIHVPPCLPDEEDSILSSVQRHMVEGMDFITCSALSTAWKPYGLIDDFDQSTVDLMGKTRPRGVEKLRGVYFHRSGAAFVRVAPGGLVFIKNVHWRNVGEIFEHSGEEEDLPLALFRSLREVVAATHTARRVVNDANSEAMDTSAARLSGPRFMGHA